MHHVFDETPAEAIKKDYLSTTSESNVPFDSHVGKVLQLEHDQAQVDLSQYRARGYKVGSIMTGYTSFH